MAKTVSAIEARKGLGKLLEEVYYRGDQFVIERAGRPMAAVVPLWQLEEWQKRQERFFGAVDEVRERNTDADPETVAQDVTKAVTATRKQSSRRKS